MKWLTMKEIQVAGEGTEKEAARMVLKHWEQMVEANQAEFRQGYRLGLFGIETKWCAMCYWRRVDCSNCLFESIVAVRCVSEVGAAGKALQRWRDEQIDFEAMHSKLVEAFESLKKRYEEKFGRYEL